MLTLIAECFGRMQEFPLLEHLVEMKAGSMPGNHIYLPYKGVSREHFRIFRSDEGWILEDLGSRNGTTVNEQKVDRVPVRAGDRIKVGVVTISVEKGAEEGETILLKERAEGRRGNETEELAGTESEPAFYFPRLTFPDGAVPGCSRAMLEVYRRLHAMTESDVHVLFVGETGTGKEILARTLHLSSRRSGGPFVAVNCAAVPGDLAESELFGIGEKVATNVARRAGKMELAHRGTLLLDELSSCPMPLQAKILRAVEEKTVFPIGENRSHPADFRLVATTNEAPRDLIAEGRLREDLYHRIATVELRIPPLRDRREDIEPLFRGMIAHAAARENKDIPGFRRRVLDLLLRYSYPGNVRELANIARSMVAQAHPGEILDLPLLPENVRVAPADSGDHSEKGKLHARLDDVTRDLVRQALEASQGKITDAAERLGVTARGLRKMMQRLGLDR